LIWIAISTIRKAKDEAMSRVGLLIPTIGISLVLVACSANAAKPKTETIPIGAVPSITSGQQIVLPLDSYPLPMRDMLTIKHASDVLAADCLRRFGFTWVPSSGTVPVAPNETRYGQIDVSTAAKWGYHAPVEPTAASTSPPPAADRVYQPGGPATYKGIPVPDGGCVTEGRHKIGVIMQKKVNGYEVWQPTWAQRLPIASFKLLPNDPRVKDTVAQWSACMAKSDHAYPDPQAAAKDPAWATPKPTSKELAVAAADVRCARGVNLAGIEYAVELAYQQRAIQRYGAELTAERAQWQGYLQNARNALAARQKSSVK